VGASHLFLNGHVVPPGDGEGVDGSGIGAVTYHVGTPGQSDAQIVANPATPGIGTLAESAFSNAYTVVARVVDRVGNSALTRIGPSATNASTTFGIDRTPPTFAFTELSTPDGAINPGIFTITTTSTDNLSGVAPFPVLHRIIGNFSSATCFHGGPGCQPLVGRTVLTANGVCCFYFTYEGVIRDQAGNASAPITRTVLFDTQPPQITAMSLPGTLVGGASTQFSASFGDNVDLKSAQHRLEFPGFSGPFSSLPFSPEAAFDVFGAPITQTQSYLVSIPFVRSLELTTGSGAPSGVLQAATATRMRVRDQAGNHTESAAVFAVGSVPTGNSAGSNDLRVQTFRVVAPVGGTLLCGGTACGGAPQSAEIAVEAAGPEGSFDNPFPRGVFFFWVDSFGLTNLIASSNAPSVVQAGGVRRWTWMVNFSATGHPVQPGVPVFAIGVDAAGDGLRSPVNTLISIVP
jgi:hypothetical protein